jgi:hypothetical protein
VEDFGPNFNKESLYGEYVREFLLIVCVCVCVYVRARARARVCARALAHMRIITHHLPSSRDLYFYTLYSDITLFHLQ